MLLGKSIKPYQAPTSGAWEIPVGQIMEEIDKISTYSFHAQLQGNRLSIVFEPYEGFHSRTITITVTAGDIFYTFKFIQATSDPSIDPRPWH